MGSIFSIFKRGLEKSSTLVTRSVVSLFTGEKKWEAQDFQRLEAGLLRADFGVPATERIVADIQDRYSRGKIATGEDILAVAREDAAAILRSNLRALAKSESGPTVLLFVGVNGSGKTTTIGKLADKLSKEGHTCMLAACDTFRAAAIEQLQLWGERTHCPVIAGKHGGDPAGIAFDAAKAAVARSVEYLLIDTAGRQHNQKNLMDELGKIRRALEKALPGSPHEVFLTVDSSLGSNAVSQAREFSKNCGVSALILTKLDGTGKGGMAVAIHDQLDLPTLFVGLGEQPDDLQDFDPELYARALFDSANQRGSSETV
ncbi:MAG: signal recognition particle-docking protein FtsY [Victivallaceae bacterium]|nr:signal recognition particle-docking protein FtsY [Victivallaceae bacterium]